MRPEIVRLQVVIHVVSRRTQMTIERPLVEVRKLMLPQNSRRLKAPIAHLTRKLP